MGDDGYPVEKQLRPTDFVPAWFRVVSPLGGERFEQSPTRARDGDKLFILSCPPEQSEHPTPDQHHANTGRSSADTEAVQPLHATQSPELPK